MNALLAIDLHNPTLPLLDEAIFWAAKTGGTLSLIFVEEVGEPWTYTIHDPSVISLLEVEREALRRSHVQRLDELMEKVPEALRGDTIVRNGIPWRSILETSELYDLLMIGTQGRTGLAHLFLGSVAERIVRTATCPVLVLRAQPALRAVTTRDQAAARR